jgi:hypothetical protein
MNGWNRSSIFCEKSESPGTWCSERLRSRSGSYSAVITNAVQGLAPLRE